MSDFSAAIAKAAEANPTFTGNTPAVPGRVIYSDGDGLAYYCAGNDETDPGQARRRMIEFLDNAKRSSGSEHHKILLTGQGSHKGHRFAVARVKPYQGQREGSRRPKNWLYLRNLLEGMGNQVELTSTAEADDLFSKHSRLVGAENIVIHTQDKDMRMTPGWHLDWATFRMVFVPEGCWELMDNDKQYGRKWFWMQMLHGDNADYVPGLPKYINAKGNPALCGPATAAKLLADCSNEQEARTAVFSLYRGFYSEDWQVQLLEQAILLWMRNDVKSSALNVLAPGNPFAGWPYQEATEQIMKRIAESQV